ncbi:MAG: hypothetical protein OEY63_04355 [Gemmatimonadota bacterium]|nr:hypothetical protein [Gemmatimonadota bacterium]MDH5804385.1 hypothetical protein [Gemmatimonadota bacterium]
MIRMKQAVTGAALLLLAVGCTPIEDHERTSRSTLVIGIDVSGSFESSGNYEDAIEFASHYLYGHLQGLGELRKPTAVFVGAVGGERPGEPKSFQPIHAFRDKSPEQITSLLRENFPPQDGFTDFNAFFERVATLVKRQNLVLAPLNIIVLSDGVPDVSRSQSDDQRYSSIDVSDLEYLSRNVTVRLLYAPPTVAVAWEQQIDRQRVRIWTVDDQVMPGWREQMNRTTDDGEEGGALWQWMHEIVDFRVRSRVI